jgi:ABC-2 type transporter
VVAALRASWLPRHPGGLAVASALRASWLPRHRCRHGAPNRRGRARLERPLALKTTAEALPGVAVTAIVGAVTFCCLGYALSTAIRSADSAQPMVQAIMLPLYFISGVFIPNVSLPRWLRDAARVFRVEHLAAGLRHGFDPPRTEPGSCGAISACSRSGRWSASRSR